MTAEDLRQRTRAFALRVIRLTEALPRGRVSDVIGRQLLRAGMSAGANYRAACRARSSAEFIAKMGIVEEELDETIYWIELLEDSGAVPAGRLADIKDEADQLLAITVASIKTARSSR